MKRTDIKKLDTLWALTVKDKAKWKCEHCGRTNGRMEAAHVVGRRHRATRWGYQATRSDYDLCGHCLCHCCHQQYDEHGPFEDAIVENTIGKGRKNELQFWAKVNVAKGQVYEDIKFLLERERAVNDDSPYAND